MCDLSDFSKSINYMVALSTCFDQLLSIAQVEGLVLD